MSRFPLFFLSTSSVIVLISANSGCMYQQPMYQPSPYGQQMYGAPGGYVQPGTMVVPPSNGTPYPPGSTYDSAPRADDFNAEKGGKFFGEDGGVPTPKDTGSDTGVQQFNRDLGT